MPEKIWTYYDENGDRVRKRHAVFAGKEVVTAAAQIRVGHAGMHRVEYRDVYHLARPDDRRHFTSKAPMLLWFHEAAATVKGRARTEH